MNSCSRTMNASRLRRACPCGWGRVNAGSVNSWPVIVGRSSVLPAVTAELNINNTFFSASCVSAHSSVSFLYNLGHI